MTWHVDPPVPPGRPPGSGPDDLPPVSTAVALSRLRDEVQRLELPMETPEAVVMRADRRRVLRLLDDYLVRRVQRRPGPLLVVIGGPTGAGKSTLLNSLVGTRVSASGVIRPTTDAPVLVYNPADGPAFFSRRLLPNLSATTVSGRHRLNPDDGSEPDAIGMRMVPSDDLVPGLAVVDSPDFDSYRTAHHDLASDLLDVADLWLYVTTGTDYAKAVPWNFLRVAAGRRLGVAAVLNRMRPEEINLVRPDLARLLTEQDLADSPVFVVPEAVLVDGRIPANLVEPLRVWLTRQVEGPARQGHLDQAVNGTIGEVLATVERLADAAADQVVADRRLRVDLRSCFRHARDVVHEAVATGSIDLGPAEEAGGNHPEPARGRRGDRLWRRLSASRPPEGGRTPAEAIIVGVSRFTHREVQEAVTRVAERWSTHPAAPSLQTDRILELRPEFDTEVEATVREWLEDVAAATLLPAHETGHGHGPGHGHGFGRPAPGTSYRVALLALGGAAAEPELAPAPSVELLEALRANLVDRLNTLIDAEESRTGEFLDSVYPYGSLALREEAAALRAAWAAESG